jgi:hypothetical protein
MKTAKEILYERLVIDSDGFHDDDSYKEQMSGGYEEQIVEAMERYHEQKLNLSGIVQASVSDEALAIEIIARFTGNSRGTPIAKKSFIDGVLWAKGRMASVASEGQGKTVSDGLCTCVEHKECECVYENKCSECGLPLRVAPARRF